MKPLFSRLLLAVVLSASVLTAAFPLPSSVDAQAEQYLCTWESGEVTRESYASAYVALNAVTEEGIELLRDGETGTIALGENARAAVRALNEGLLGDLLPLNAEGMNRMEQAALCRLTEDRVYFDGCDDVCYAWTGTSFAITDRDTAREVVLLNDTVPASTLIELNATVLSVRSAGELTCQTLVGTNITEVYAQAYAVEDGAVYLDTEGGRRLITALPLVKSLRIEADYTDEKSLSACRVLEELTLPFVGNSREYITDYDGNFGYIFGKSDGKYVYPSTLKKVKILGGELIDNAFYGCESVEEIDICGIKWYNISATAFLDCRGLQRLHSPRWGMQLDGRYRHYTASCGCTVYERA